MQAVCSFSRALSPAKSGVVDPGVGGGSFRVSADSSKTDNHISLSVPFSSSALCSLFLHIIALKPLYIRSHALAYCSSFRRLGVTECPGWSFCAEAPSATPRRAKSLLEYMAG